MESTRDELKKLKIELEKRDRESELMNLRDSLKSDHTFGDRFSDKDASPQIRVKKLKLNNLKSYKFINEKIFFYHTKDSFHFVNSSGKIKEEDTFILLSEAKQEVKLILFMN